MHFEMRGNPTMAHELQLRHFLGISCTEMVLTGTKSALSGVVVMIMTFKRIQAFLLTTERFLFVAFL